jgi:ATP-dependent protease ClpP protease subunit
MPSWDQVLTEIRSAGSTHDVVRRKYLKELHDYTGRNTIIYYSGWLEKGHLARQGVTGFELNDSDKNGFMAAIHNLDRDLGLDLIIHTPGGATAATESLVDYLRAMFGTNMRAIVPHLAMSAGTMVALACNEIVMGKHSSLGPIDPQIYGMPAHGVVEEFQRAAEEISNDPAKVPVWQPIIANYRPTLIGECEKAIEWSTEMVEAWLRSGMYADDPAVDQKVQQVLEELGDHALTKSHERHISAARADEIGLNVAFLEDDQELQERVLTVHHACTVSLSEGGAIKIIENHNGVAHINTVELRQ